MSPLTNITFSKHHPELLDITQTPHQAGASYIAWPHIRLEIISKVLASCARMRLLTHLATGALALAHLTAGLDLTINDTQSVHDTASTIAYHMVSYYHGNESGGVPGLLGDPYYWWECGGEYWSGRGQGRNKNADYAKPCSIH